MVEKEIHKKKIVKENIDMAEEKKQHKNMGMLISVVLNIVLFIVCADAVSVRFRSETSEDKIWNTAVANGLYCAQAFAEHGGDEAYYYIIGETGTLVDLLPYTSFGDNQQKKQVENLYSELVLYPDEMKAKGKEIEDIFTMLSEKDEKVFEKMEELYHEVTGQKETEAEDEK